MHFCITNVKISKVSSDNRDMYLAKVTKIWPYWETLYRDQMLDYQLLLQYATEERSMSKYKWRRIYIPFSITSSIHTQSGNQALLFHFVSFDVHVWIVHWNYCVLNMCIQSCTLYWVPEYVHSTLYLVAPQMPAKPRHRPLGLISPARLYCKYHTLLYCTLE